MGIQAFKMYLHSVHLSKNKGELPMKIQTTIQKWGNSLAIRITGPLKTIPHFTADMPVEIEANKRGLTIHPIIPKKRNLLLFNEAQLLKGLTAKKVHADEIANIHLRELE